MKAGILPLGLLISACGFAATDVRVDFILKTTDAHGAAVQQRRHYSVYRPDGLSKATPAPMVLVMDECCDVPAAFFHQRADQAGFLVVSCSYAGNSTGTPGSVWINGNPATDGMEDYDYATEVIHRVQAAENGGDAFITGLSKGGHMALAYACARPSMIRAAASVDEFMGLTTNIPSGPVPMIMFHGTHDLNVPYVMAKDTFDVWRAVDGLLDVTPETTYEASPLVPGKVSQATWRGGKNGVQAAFVTIVGGGHNYATPSITTGYDCTDGMWSFFSQFLTGAPATPKIVSQPADNVQPGGQPASFHVTATGAGPLSYQWRKDGVDISGATSSWLTISATPSDNGAKFGVAVRNRSGSVASATATLTVKTADRAGPAIVTGPADRAVTAGQAVSFTVAASGAPPLTYRWQKNGMDIDGASSATLAIPAAIQADAGASLTAIVSNAAGSVVSPPATLSVTPAARAPAIVTNPARSRVQAGERGTFSVTARSASPMRYQWQSGVFTGNMADIAGANGEVYTTPPAALAENHKLFRCVVSNAAGNAASAAEMLFVTAGPAGR